MRFSLICVTLSIFFIGAGVAQPVKSKKLPHPEFYVIGIVENQFPKFEGNWNDTNSLKQHGNQIDEWIKANPNKVKDFAVLISNPERCKINKKLFESLNVNQKTKFKEASVTLSYLIFGQKQILLNSYFSKASKERTKNDFYEDVTQVYCIHLDNLNYLYSLIVE